MILLRDPLTSGGWLQIKINMAFILFIWPKKSAPVHSF